MTVRDGPESASLLGERKKRNCLPVTMATCRGSVIILLLLHAYHFVDVMRSARALLLESEAPWWPICAPCLARDRRRGRRFVGQAFTFSTWRACARPASALSWRARASAS